MSLALVHSRAQVGVQAPAVSVENHLANGLPSLTLVGGHYDLTIVLGIVAADGHVLVTPLINIVAVQDPSLKPGVKATALIEAPHIMLGAKA